MTEYILLAFGFFFFSRIEMAMPKESSGGKINTSNCNTKKVFKFNMMYV
jgi:hypothetical protein